MATIEAFKYIWRKRGKRRERTRRKRRVRKEKYGGEEDGGGEENEEGWRNIRRRDEEDEVENEVREFEGEGEIHKKRQRLYSSASVDVNSFGDLTNQNNSSFKWKSN